MNVSDAADERTAVAGIPAAAAWTIANRHKSEPMFGLIRLELDIQIDRPLDGAKSRIRFGDHEARFPIQRLISPTSKTGKGIRIHLLTHLVLNGSTAIDGDLTWPDGTVYPLPRATYCVENVGTLADQVRDDLQVFGTPAILGAVLDSRVFPPQDGLKARAWFNSSGLDTDVPLSFDPAPTAELARMHLVRWGFTIMDYVIDRSTIDQFRREYETAIDNGTLPYKRGTSQRIQQAHNLPTGRKIWLDDRVLRFLGEWFRDEPCACQTLLYIHGSTQHAHQDTIHLTPYPAGFMCGVWVALQDIEPDSGELFVLPGSHRTPRVMTRDVDLPKVTEDYSAYKKLNTRIDELIADNTFQVVPYRPKAGQILVWHENLIHGGAPRVNADRERHSIVSHYFARGSVAYYDARGEGAALERVE